MARAGGGVADFVTNLQTEDVEGKVQRQLARCLSACQIEFHWPKSSKVVQVPPGPQIVGESDRLQLFALCDQLPK